MRPIQRLHLLEPDDENEEAKLEEKGDDRQPKEADPLMLVNPSIDQGPQDVPTYEEDRIPMTTTRYGRKSFKPDRL